MEYDSKEPSLVLRNKVGSSVPYTLVQEKSLEDISRPFSWVIVDKDLKILVKNIVLKQEPKEVLDTEISFERTSSINNGKIKHHYQVRHMKIRFQNYLHVFGTNYAYEVLCQRSHKSTSLDEHLFLFVEQRRKDTMEAGEICFTTLKALTSEDLRIYIRRLNLSIKENETRQYIDSRTLLQEVPADIKLVFGGENVPVHKCVLTHSSAVFKTMLNSEMLEAETGVVKIDDFRVEVIKEMLNFLYTGNIVHVEMRYELLKVAHKYQLHDLYQRCKEYIVFNSKCENIADTLNVADLYEIVELKKGCMKLVNMHKVIMSKQHNFQLYLCESMNVNNVVIRLLFAKKYSVENVSMEALNFISNHFCIVSQNKSFLALYESNPSLVKEIMNYYCKARRTRNK